MPRRSKGLAFLLGVLVLAVCLTGQVSSVLTPSLVRFPFLLYLFSRGGVLILLLAAIVVLAVVLCTKSRRLYPLSLLYIVLTAVCQLNVWGQAFQLSVAGLTVGGSLIVLSSYPLKKTS